MNDPKPPVIIVGAHTVGLAVLRAFKDLPIKRILVSYSKTDPARVSKYVSRLYDSPHPEESTGQFLENLESICQDNPGAMLIPASDPALSVISLHKEELFRYATVACPPYNIVQQLIDKQFTYTVAQSIGIPVPITSVPKTEDDAYQYALQVEYPCLIKPCKSHLYFDIFHKKMVLAQTRDELMKAYLEAKQHQLDVLLQEFIPGGDQNGVNYNSYRVDNRRVVNFTAKKIRNAPPQLGSPCVLISKIIPSVVEMGDRLLHEFGLNGFSCMEFKQDQRDGLYKLMEINARHNLSGLLATHTGINFPLIEYQHLMLDMHPGNYHFEEGIYWIDISRDIAYNWKQLFRKPVSLIDTFKPYFAPHIFAIYDPADMRPSLKRTSHLLMDGLSGRRSVN